MRSHLGTDVNCESFIPKHAQSALDKKLITEDDIDEHMRNLFRVRFRLGHFDPAGPLQQFPLEDVCSDYAIALSLDGPVQASALIKNENDVLPLGAKGAGTVAIIGPNANLSKSDVTYVPCTLQHDDDDDDDVERWMGHLEYVNAHAIALQRHRLV